MLSNFNIEHILTFPFKETEDRKNFLIGILVYFASFIIPILPLIFAMGYIARIMRQVFNGETPHMPAWDDWESMFKDGLYLFGIRIVYTLPLIIILLPLFFGIAMIFIFPLSLALGIIVPTAELHTIAHNDFAAGFRIREWRTIFRANWSGFVLAYLVSMVAGFVLTFIVQVAMITIVLICVLPFIMPAITFYITLVMYTAFAQAYKDGKDRLAQ